MLGDFIFFFFFFFSLLFVGVAVGFDAANGFSRVANEFVINL